jgi:hypothetical protein
VKSKAWLIYCEGFGDSDEESGETTRGTMKDSGNKMRDLGRHYEVFGENAAVAAMDMKTEMASNGKSGTAVKSVARPLIDASMKDLGKSDPPLPLACSTALKPGNARRSAFRRLEMRQL